MLYLLRGAVFGFAAAAQPGPFQTYLITQTVSKGWRKTLPAALAPLLSDGPILLLVLFVLSQVPAWLQRLLYLAGGLFIVYLAFNALLAWRNFRLEEPGPETSNQRSLLRAALMNALNPNPYIFWSLVTGPILVAGWHEAPVNGVGFLAGFYAAMIFSLGVIILVFGTARRLGPKVNRALLGISALVLFIFGLYQFWQGMVYTTQ
jgi:threonine/homoserine/homoserine lactone efflux protein